MAEPEPNTCTNPNCAGSGYIDNEPCPTCFGTGSLPVKGAAPRILKKLKDIEDNINDIMDKCNDIFAKVNE